MEVGQLVGKLLESEKASLHRHTTYPLVLFSQIAHKRVSAIQMENGYSNGTIFGPDLSLTPDQQSLLRTALSSNNPGPAVSSTGSLGSGSPVRNGKMRPIQQESSPQGASIQQSPIQSTPLIDDFPLDDSPFMDGQDFEDANFDWDNSGDQLFGDLPGELGHEEDIHDKRKGHTGDEDEDGKHKRHEGIDKTNKKPGRKPLNNSEPTTVSLEIVAPSTMADVVRQETQSTEPCCSKGVP